MYDMLIPNTFVYNVLAMMLIPAWTTKNKRLVSTFNKTINKKKVTLFNIFSAMIATHFKVYPGMYESTGIKIV